MPFQNDGLILLLYCNAITQNYGTVSKLGGPLSQQVFYGSRKLTSYYRGYPLKKVQENNEAEIMNVVLEEAREAYAEEIVIPLQSECTEDLESNVARIVQWIEAWRKNQQLDSGS